MYPVAGAGTLVTWVQGQLCRQLVSEERRQGIAYSVMVRVVASVTVYVFEPWTTVVGAGQ